MREDNLQGIEKRGGLSEFYRHAPLSWGVEAQGAVAPGRSACYLAADFMRIAHLLRGLPHTHCAGNFQYLKGLQ